MEAIKDNKIGEYIGNGTSITIELGFRPSKIRLINATQDYSEEVLKMEGMETDTCQLNKNSKGKILSGGITIMDDGFAVGINQYVNRNGDIYLWEAF